MSSELVIADEHIQTETQSPFLPGTNIQYAWDSTSLGYLKTCPRLYYYRMIEGWEPIGESIHLRFGIEYHKALELYDKTIALGTDHDEALNYTVQETLISTHDFAPKEEDFGKVARYKNRRNLIKAVIWYLDKYPHDKDPAQTFILENGKPAVELSFRLEMDFEPNYDYELVCVNGHDRCESGPFDGCPYCEKRHRQPYLLCGHLDRVVDYNDALFWMDRKSTTSTPGDYYFDQYDPNNQMSLYNIASKAVLHSPVRGGIIDVVQLQLDHPEFKRGFTYRTEDRSEEWLSDTADWLEKAEGYAEKDYWPMNDTSCDKFGGCPFREVCRKDRKLRENFLKSHFNQKSVEERWNPLAPR